MQLIHKNVFFSRLKKYKYLVFIAILLIFIILGSYFFYNSYNKNKANANSLIFSNVQEKLMENKTEEALSLLINLSKNGTLGYKLLSYLQQATISIDNKNFDKALALLKEIGSLNVPQYYKDFAQYISYSIRLEHTPNLQALIEDINKNVKPSNTLYFSNLEILSIALYSNKEYNQALVNLDKIINSNKVPKGLKERAKILKSLTLAYVK